MWPEELIHFLERPVPVYIHLAASKRGKAPFVCRGYGALADMPSRLMWIYILQSQWVRLNEIVTDQNWLAALLTAGTDNESYQVKGTFHKYRPMTKEDRAVMESQRKRTADYFPYLLPLVSVDPAACLAVSLDVQEVYVQTPGPNAGTLLAERSR